MTSNIVIAPDNNVVDPTFVLLNSIKMNNSDNQIKIFLLYCDLSDENKVKIIDYAQSINLRISTHYIDIKKIKVLRQKMRVGHVTATSLLRCFMSEALPKNLCKILYLDIDTIVTCSLTDLFEINLNGKIAGVVRDLNINHLASFGINENLYFNSGVMLIDLEQWRKNHIEKIAYDFMEKHPDKCIYWDQCALNYALLDKVKFLPASWNTMGNQKGILKHSNNVSIIHYAGLNKPWIKPELHPFGVYYSIFSQNTPAPIEFDLSLLHPKKDPRLTKFIKRLRKSILKRIIKKK